MFKCTSPHPCRQRNPSIKLYGLSWTFPAWVGQGSGSPYAHPNTTAGYITKWILGAKKVYDLTIDYVGVRTIIHPSLLPWQLE